jgi:hypothetical protein
VKVIERPVVLKEQSQYQGQAQGGAIGVTGGGGIIEMGTTTIS